VSSWLVVSEETTAVLELSLSDKLRVENWESSRAAAICATGLRVRVRRALCPTNRPTDSTASHPVASLSFSLVSCRRLASLVALLAIRITLRAKFQLPRVVFPLLFETLHSPEGERKERGRILLLSSHRKSTKASGKKSAKVYNHVKDAQPLIM